MIISFLVKFSSIIIKSYNVFFSNQKIIKKLYFLVMLYFLLRYNTLILNLLNFRSPYNLFFIKISM